MNIYSPNRWTILKIDIHDTDEIMYRVLGGWSGGYLDGDSWRLSSPIVSYEHYEDNALDMIRFFNESGSTYSCVLPGEGLNMIMSGALNSLKAVEGISTTNISFNEYIKEVNNDNS